MVSYPGPWAFSIPKPGVIFVSDAEIETLAADPDKAIDLSLVPGQKYFHEFTALLPSPYESLSRTYPKRQAPKYCSL